MSDKILRILILIICFVLYYFFFYGCGASGYGKFEFEHPIWSSHTCSGEIIHSILTNFFWDSWDLKALVRFIYWPLNLFCFCAIWIYRVKITNFVKNFFNSI